jgi:hypothetical protein
VRVHEILRSDLGHDPHDHPWSYLTIVLKGGYWEHRYEEIHGYCVWQSSKWHGPGSILWRQAGSLHMLSLPPGKTATTLFITGSKVRSWGFQTPSGFINHREYRGKQ